MHLPDVSKSIESFFNGMAKIIAQMRKDKVAGIKAIVLVTMYLIALITIASVASKAPFWALFLGGYGFLGIFYFIMSACLKTDRRSRSH